MYDSTHPAIATAANGDGWPRPLPATLEPGRWEPLGAHARDGGVNFAFVAEHAQRVELCLFDAAGERELHRVTLHGPDDGIHHGFMPGAGPGAVYGLRAHGPRDIAAGHRYNPAKLLLDPWAREITGRFEWRDEHLDHEGGHPGGLHAVDRRDNAPWAHKARVAPPWNIDTSAPPPPRVPARDLLLYEVHVKGYSRLHPDIPAEMRGTFSGLAHPASIAHLRRLGVTTLSLLPVQMALDEPALAARGTVNYWGYNTLGFFYPSPRLSCTPHDPTAVNREFRAMVDALHAAGLEVVLDVVYNHTPEGDERGPTLSWRGLDQAMWYRLASDDRSRCENLTGCGNTLNVAHPRVTQFVLDSLRHWVQVMGVDGFRFDLAPVLGRTRHGFDAHAAFFTALRQDPVLARVHLIAEPWDVAHDGYQLGRFPGRFLEWNDKFRDSVRRYWLAPWLDLGGHGHNPHRVGRGEFARRYTASADVFHHGGRSPLASVNYLAVHDGYTLADLVSYSHKHNEANGEGNRDGRDGEPSANLGAEGPGNDAARTALRTRVRRALMATLLLSQGTPMLCAGDELGRTQRGNNNAYCQDGPLSWLDWERAEDDFLAFVRELTALLRAEPALRHQHWFGLAGGLPLSWLAPNGHSMGHGDWCDPHALPLACLIGRGTDHAPGGSARLMLAFNPLAHDTAFTLPHGCWQVALDSTGTTPTGTDLPAVAAWPVPAHGVVVLRSATP